MPSQPVNDMLENTLGRGPLDSRRGLRLRSWVLLSFQAADGNLLDGSAFHKGTRLRQDCAIRERLRGGTAGWAIVKLKASDLRRGVLADWIR